MMITRRDEALEKVSGSSAFFLSQDAICYTMRILCIMNTFSILDDFIFFFSTRREQGNLTFVTLPYPSAAHQLSRLPLLFPKACRRHYQRRIYSQHQSIYIVSRLWICEDITQLPRSPRHTLSHIFSCFPHVSGSEIFFLFGFFAHPLPAHPSCLISERKSKNIETTGPSIASIRRRG